MKIIIALIAITTITGCTWVNENPSGQSVAITNADTIRQCPQVGKINVSTKHKVGFIKRGSKKILSELQTLARNEALKINANTIAPESNPVDGKQSYLAFACPR